MNLGDKLKATELINTLDSAGVLSQKPDSGFEDLKSNLAQGWTIDHICYKPQLRFWLKGQPGFLFHLKHSENSDDPRNLEPFEVPYGPKVREFVLAQNIDVYYKRNVEHLRKLGWTSERIYSEA